MTEIDQPLTRLQRNYRKLRDSKPGMFRLLYESKRRTENLVFILGPIVIKTEEGE